MEWPAGGGSPRVIPVAILVDGHFYDASIYRADPIPMALDPGNVYEVEQSGESVGLVTLTDARQAKNGAWLADARFQSHEQLASARRPRETPSASATVQEGPPKLRRGKGRSAPESTPQPTSKPEPQPSPEPRGPDEPPVLRRPPSETQPETKTEPQPTAQSSSSAPAASEDSDHPVLRRGRPTAEQAENLPGAVEAKAAPKAPAAAAGRITAATKVAAASPGRVLAAISDADGPEPRSFALPWKAEDQQKLKASMIDLASAALADWARTHGGTRPGALQDVQVRAFDLTSSNEPLIILMAHATETTAALPVRRGAANRSKQGATPTTNSATGLTYWVTVAARENYDGELRKLKVWATDSKHLDAYPRAELIDAVDADGNGRGELLFREISDIGQSFVIYRATPDTLTELYNSAELER